MNSRTDNQDVKLNEKQLLVLKEYALRCKHDQEKFDQKFKNGFFDGMVLLMNKADKLEKLRTLEEFAAHGNCIEFQKLFEAEKIDINTRFTASVTVSGSENNFTFLRLVLEYDIYPAGDARAEKHIQLAKYLLSKGASIDIKPQDDLTGSEGSSCSDLIDWKPGRIRTLLGNFINTDLGFGKNLLPILEAHRRENRLEIK